MTGSCNVLIVGPYGAQWASCKPCRWEGPSRSIEEMARLDGQALARGLLGIERAGVLL